MATPKYKKFYDLMLSKNGELFKQFSQIHAGFVMDEKKWAEQFHAVGRDVLDVIRDWERRLCAGTEKGGYGQYSAGLSDKFWAEIEKTLPLIKQVGLKKG